LSVVRLWLLSPEGLALATIIIDGTTLWEGVCHAILNEFESSTTEKTNEAINNLEKLGLIKKGK
jgi:hypothetical protein